MTLLVGLASSREPVSCRVDADRRVVRRRKFGTSEYTRCRLARLLACSTEELYVVPADAELAERDLILAVRDGYVGDQLTQTAFARAKCLPCP